ncbi:hypothetical protein BDQ17DRAFT_1364538 [Cyathus striatus]|nr:hypothetical protein BDQ17DRAFT_1364538 [Cyathus striatus]
MILALQWLSCVFPACVCGCVRVGAGVIGLKRGMGVNAGRQVHLCVWRWSLVDRRGIGVLRRTSRRMAAPHSKLLIHETSPVYWAAIFETLLGKKRARRG